MDKIIQNIFPSIACCFANKKIEKMTKKQEFQVDISQIKHKEIKNYINKIKRDFKEQIDRKKRIEDKSKHLLSIIAVSVTAITFSINYFGEYKFTNEINCLKTIQFYLILLSILYLICGTISTIRSLDPIGWENLDLEIKTEMKGEYILQKQELNENYLKELVKSKKKNDYTHIILANYVNTSFRDIRNGIILFSSFFFLEMLFAFFCLKKPDTNLYEYKKNIEVKINDSIGVNIPYKFNIKFDIENFELDTNHINLLFQNSQTIQ